MTSRLLMLLIVISDVSAYIELIGAGATVPSGVYVTWMAAYKSSRASFADVRLTYKPMGSGFGKRAIASRSVHYAGSDSLLSDEEYEKNPDLQMFPSIALSVSRFSITASSSSPSSSQRLSYGCNFGGGVTFKALMESKHIGVARGCTGYTCTPWQRKKLGPNLQGKVVSAPPGRQCTPEAEQESNFGGIWRYGR